MKVLITGSSGYLGRNCIEALSALNLVEIALFSTSKKNISSQYPCYTYLDSLKSLHFDYVLHAGWGGVTSEERNSEIIQFNNFLFTKQLLSSINFNYLRGFIFLGSQAEYGNITHKIKEEDLAKPTSYYGLYKKLSGEYLEFLSQEKCYKYYHLRIFSIFGGDQNKTWLMPSLIENIISEKEIKITHPKKKISLLHISDFTRIITEIILGSIASGTYNICNSDYTTIEDLVTIISTKLNRSDLKILNHQKHSETNLIGDNSKILSQLEKKSFLTLDQGIKLLLENEGI